MIKPVPLKKGDTIALISPSSPTDQNLIKKCVGVVEKLGLNVVVGKSCLCSHGFLSGTDEIRAYDINSMFANRKINGIMALRGGYGSTRLLDLINYEIIKNNPKVFVGYSDITALHIAFNQRCNLITYHAPMISTELVNGLDDYTKYYYEKNLFSNCELGEINNPSGNKIETLIPGRAEGILIGGNLSIICSTLATKYEINTKDKILFIEDVDESPYRIDRMLVQLKQAGKLNDAKGIIVGAFTNCIAENPEKSLSIEDILKEVVLKSNKPTISNLACGHCMPTLSLPLGAKVSIDTYKNLLKITE